MAKKANTAQEQLEQPVPPPVQPEQRKELVLNVTESAANALLAMVTDLPWKQANPIIQHIQQTFKAQVSAPADEQKGE